MPELFIRPMQPADWPAVREIYREGIAGQNATFEQNAPTWEHWDREHLPGCRLVATREGVTLGWAALSPVSRRAAYAGVAEVSVYIAVSAQRCGVGRALLQRLVAESERAGIWTLQGSVFPENAASLGLCEAAGFRRVGTREKIGKMNGRWRDTVIIERRSPIVG